MEAATRFLGVLHEANRSNYTGGAEGGRGGAGAGAGGAAAAGGGTGNNSSYTGGGGGGSGGGGGGGGGNSSSSAIFLPSVEEDIFLPYTGFYNDAVNCDDFNIKAGPGSYCLPRHRMPFNSRCEVSNARW